MKLCLYFNYPSLYRKEIYTRIDSEYDPTWYFEDRESNIKPFELSHLKDAHKLQVVKLGAFYWTIGLLGLLRKGFSHYILIGATRNLSLYIFLILKNLFYRKKKVALWTHGYYGKERWIEKNIFKRSLLKMADRLLLYGNYARELMIQDGFSPEKTLTIHNSLAYTKQLQLRKLQQISDIYKEHFGNSHPVLLFLGRLTAVKKLDMILEAMALLNGKGQFYNVVFVGDGPMREYLHQYSQRLGLQAQVWFYGACFDEEKNAELVYNADLCVAPGNVGLTAIHSLMFGCPVVTHNDFNWQMPEFESIIPGKTGCFFKRNDISSLADTISSWFYLEPRKREEIRQLCYAEIDNNWNPDFQLRVIQQFIID